VTDMFVGTACPSTEDPDLSVSPAMPFCEATCTLEATNNSTSMVPAPSAMPGNGTATMEPATTTPGGNATSAPSGFQCFASNEELGAAVREYVLDDSAGSQVALQYGYPISSWCVDQVTNMDGIFKGQASFNDDLEGWDTSAVTSMRGTFEGCTAMNGRVEAWNTSAVEDMSYMVCTLCVCLVDHDVAAGCVPVLEVQTATMFAIQQQLILWFFSLLFSNHTITQFAGASSFDQSLFEWDTANVKNMSAMVRACLILVLVLCALLLL